jgi:hypothetical protein
MMTRIERAIASLLCARAHLKAAGAPPSIIEHLDAVIAMLIAETP